MKTNSQQDKNQKIKQEKPKRDKKRQQDLQFEKDLIQLIRLREQNHLIKQFGKIVQQRIKQNQNLNEKLRLLSWMQSINHKIIVQQIMLLKVLQQRPQIMTIIPNISEIFKLRLVFSIRSMEEFLQFIEKSISLIDLDEIQIVQSLKKFLSDLEDSENHSIETNQQTEQSETK